MGLILSIETSTKNSSVALALNGEILSIKESTNKRPSEVLHLYIQEVFENTDFSLQDLQAIAISRGPGSYTGLRIGTSAAKGLCFALDIPLIALETLDLLFEQGKNPAYDFIIPMLDARRMEVYTATYNLKNNTKTATNAKVLDQNSFKELHDKGQVLCIGTGVKKFQEVCDGPNFSFTKSLPSSREMIKLAQVKFNNKDFEDTAYFEPYYLKDFVGRKP